jgi:hypothetical protein
MSKVNGENEIFYTSKTLIFYNEQMKIYLQTK